jgi:CHAD domain-containing protein
VRLDVEPGFVLPALGGRPLPVRTITTTYLDTPDRRLRRAGITLRRVVENRTGVWHLELPDHPPLEQRGGPKVPARFLDLLPALTRGVDLADAARTRTTREGVAVGPRAERVEVTVDRVVVLEGGRIASRFAQVDVPDAASAIAKTLGKAGARPAVSGPERVLGAVEAVASGDEPVERLRRQLVAQYDAILAHDPGTRLGDDPEALHQLRVATRRSRALLRAAGGLLANDWAAPLREQLKWLGGLLGPVRDLDVLLEYLDGEVAGLEGEDARAFRRLRSRLALERNADRAALLEGMASARYFRLLDVLEGADSAPAGDGGDPPVELARREFKRLRKAAKALPKVPADEALHEIRIDAKRARYSAELAAPDLGKAGARFLDRAKDLQDVIGEHQDACVAETRLRALALHGGGKTGLTAGRLIERQQRRRRNARRAYPGAWARLEKSGRKAFK